MKNTIKLIATASLLFSMAAANAGTVVIVNAGNANKPGAQEVKDIFLGKAKNFADGTSAIAVLPRSGKAREGFFADVLGKTEAQYKSAWAALVFTGKAQPPKEVDSEEEVAKLVASNPSMIGVVDSAKADKGVKVVQ